MAIYLMSLILLFLGNLLTSFANGDVHAHNEIDNDLMLKFTSRLELLEKRDEIMQAEIKHLRTELEDERKKTAMVLDLVLQLNPQQETQVVKHEQKTDASITTVPDGGRLNATTAPEATNLYRESFNNASKKQNMQGDRHIRKNKKGLTGSGAPIETTGDVSFFATLGGHLQHLGAKQDIPFDQIITNRGNAYSRHTGAFTAPVTGTYVFATTLRVHGFNNTHYTLVQNGQVITNIYLGGVDAPFSTSSVTAVLELSIGDVVAIQNVEVDNYLNGNSYSSFAGFLLRLDYSAVSIVG